MSNDAHYPNFQLTDKTTDITFVRVPRNDFYNTVDCGGNL